MWKTELYTLDHQEFRRLVSSGERGLAARLQGRPGPGGRALTESERETLEGILGDIETKGSVEETDDRRTNDLVNVAIWLIAEEAGIDATAGAVATATLEQAHDVLGKGGFLRKALLAPVAATLFAALFEGRVYGTEEPWDADLRTTVLDPGEARLLHSHLRDMADARGSKLSGVVQDLLDQHVFPILESASRAQLGVLAVTRHV